MALWYNQGTISVTNGSATVTGVGTQWGSGNVAPGDAFIGPDNNSYPIQSVTSDTEIILQIPYGTFASDEYLIQPTRAFSAEALRSTQDFIAAIAAFRDGPLAGRFGDGTAQLPGIGFLSSPTMGFRRAAANSTAFTSAGSNRVTFSNTAMQVDVPMTGTAVQTSPTDTTAGRIARADYAYGPGNVIGTVSRSGTTVTGAVIERGSNANGEYVRFADGTQICWMESGTITASISSGDGSFVSSTVSADFPASFTGTAAVIASARVVSGAIGHDVSGAAALNTTQAVARLKTTTSGAQGIITFVAIGRHSQGVS